MEAKLSDRFANNSLKELVAAYQKNDGESTWDRKMQRINTYLRMIECHVLSPLAFAQINICL